VGSRAKRVKTRVLPTAKWITSFDKKINFKLKLSLINLDNYFKDTFLDSFTITSLSYIF